MPFSNISFSSGLKSQVKWVWKHACAVARRMSRRPPPFGSPFPRLHPVVFLPLKHQVVIWFSLFDQNTTPFLYFCCLALTTAWRLVLISSRLRHTWVAAVELNLGHCCLLSQEILHLSDAQIHSGISKEPSGWQITPCWSFIISYELTVKTRG